MEFAIPCILRSIDSIDFSWALSITPGPRCFVRGKLIQQICINKFNVYLFVEKTNYEIGCIEIEIERTKDERKNRLTLFIFNVIFSYDL